MGTGSPLTFPPPRVRMGITDNPSRCPFCRQLGDQCQIKDELQGAQRERGRKPVIKEKQAPSPSPGKGSRLEEVSPAGRGTSPTRGDFLSHAGRHPSTEDGPAVGRENKASPEAHSGGPFVVQ